MSALARVCDDLGYTTIGLAPSAAASAVLREATGMATETLAKLDHLLASRADLDIGSRTVVVIDEADMADTPTLDRIIAASCDRGARVRVVGDDQQLALSAPAACCVTSPPRTAPYASTRSFASPTRRGHGLARPARRQPDRSCVLPRPRPDPHRRRGHEHHRRPHRVDDRESSKPLWSV